MSGFRWGKARIPGLSKLLETGERQWNWGAIIAALAAIAVAALCTYLGIH